MGIVWGNRPVGNCPRWNCLGVIVLGWNCLGGGGNCPRLELSGSSCPGGNCLGRNCPGVIVQETKKNMLKVRKNVNHILFANGLSLFY